MEINLGIKGSCFGFVEILQTYQIESYYANQMYCYYQGKILDRMRFTMFIMELIRVCKGKGYRIVMEFNDELVTIFIG